MPDLKPKPFVFVLMPFNAEFDDVYRCGIKPACERAGAYAERVDEQVFQGSILQRIYNQIAKADVVVADMTGRNPNVFYETGYAHALGRPVIHLAQSTDDIPFDLKHYPHLIYNRRIVDLLPELERRVRMTLEAPAGASRRMARVVVDGFDTASGPVVLMPIREKRVGFTLNIEINNEITSSARPLSCQVGLVTSREWVRASFGSQKQVRGFRLDDAHRLFLSDDFVDVLPGSWARLTVTPVTDNRTLTDGETFSMSIRLFTENGYEDHAITVHTQLQREGKAPAEV